MEDPASVLGSDDMLVPVAAALRERLFAALLGYSLCGHLHGPCVWSDWEPDGNNDLPFATSATRSACTYIGRLHFCSRHFLHICQYCSFAVAHSGLPADSPCPFGATTCIHTALCWHAWSSRRKQYRSSPRLEICKMLLQKHRAVSSHSCQSLKRAGDQMISVCCF